MDVLAGPKTKAALVPRAAFVQGFRMTISDHSRACGRIIRLGFCKVNYGGTERPWRRLTAIRGPIRLKLEAVGCSFQAMKTVRECDLIANIRVIPYRFWGTIGVRSIYFPPETQDGHRSEEASEVPQWRDGF